MQQYPVKPVRIVVGFAPGGGSDFIARLIAQKLTERFGTQVMVDNRPGAGSTLAAEQVVDVAKIRLVHVPYKGTGPALNDTIGGQVQVILGSVATALQHVRSGRLRALAVTTPKRISAAADVPTVQEAGFPAYEVTNWHGLVGPKGLPKDVLDRLSKEVNAMLQSPEMAKILASDGLEPAGGTPEEFAVIIKSELARWNQVVKQAGVKLE